jgi:hypothetical protein
MDIGVLGIIVVAVFLVFLLWEDFKRVLGRKNPRRVR